ncbi:CsbD family protein [Rhodovulum sp. DZ06]|uniref:CsbD family protein n=1 Tax=Rhodovulum sp. DZ06 TaxID=3425126 RepID=UPI003D33098B
MNWDVVKGNWSQLKGQVQSEWGKLTDDEVAQAEGDKDKLVGLIQEKYGYAKDEAEQKLDAFFKKAS